jgi:hypothetical protein
MPIIIEYAVADIVDLKTDSVLAITVRYTFVMSLNLELSSCGVVNNGQNDQEISVIYRDIQCC